MKEPTVKIIKNYKERYDYAPIITTLCKPEEGWAEMFYPPAKMIEVWVNPLKLQVIYHDGNYVEITYCHNRKNFEKKLRSLMVWTGNDNFEGFNCLGIEKTYQAFEKLGIEWMAELKIRDRR